jgi:hypothetical protein
MRAQLGGLGVDTMKNNPDGHSIVTCISKRDGTVVKVGTASALIGPTLVDPFNVVLGATCGEWGVGIYLTLADAARLQSKLERLIADHAERG